MNIFDLTFYGIRLYKPNCKPQIRVSLSKEDWHSEKRRKIRKLFTAKVLKRYKDNTFVVEINDFGDLTYVPLFNPNLYYDEEKEKWVECEENEIVSKIIKCYIKNANKFNEASE